MVSSSRYDIGVHGFDDENHVSVQSQPRKVQCSNSGDESISDEVGFETEVSFPFTPYDA